MINIEISLALVFSDSLLRPPPEDSRLVKVMGSWGCFSDLTAYCTVAIEPSRRHVTGNLNTIE